MKQIVTRAIILKRVNFSEADRILTVLTADKGIITVLAKGVRRPKSKLAGGLELFSVSQLTYIDGRSEVKTIVSTRLEKFYSAIVRNPAATLVAYDCMKFVSEQAQHSSDSFYFLTLQQVFHALDEGIDAFSVYVWCVVRIMQHEGSSMNLEKPINAATFSEDAQYSFSFEDMAFAEDKTGSYTPKHIKFLRLITRLKQASDVSKIDEHERLAADLSKLLQHVVVFNHA